MSLRLFATALLVLVPATEWVRAQDVRPRSGMQLTSVVSLRSSFDAAVHAARFEEAVVVETSDMTIRCDVLELELVDSELAGVIGLGGQMKRALATGNVVVETFNQENEPVTAVAERALFDVANQTVILSGHPVIHETDQHVAGTSSATEITLNNRGQYWVRGPSRTFLKDLGGKGVPLPDFQIPKADF